MPRMSPWLLAILGLALGCEARSVRRICTLPESCGCTMLTDVNSCQNSIQNDASQAQEEANMRGLPFDVDCYLARLDEFVDVLGCRTPAEVGDEYTRLQLCGACDVIHGDKPEGATCEQLSVGGFVSANASDCAAGLRCVGGFCLDVCRERAAGEACVLDLADGSTTTYACAGGSCDFNTRTCVAGLADGQPCTSDDACTSGWCRQSVCGGPPKLGDPCSFDGECGDALACDGAACVALPGPGQPCPDFRCAPGSSCRDPNEQDANLDYQCVEDGPWVCPFG